MEGGIGKNIGHRNNLPDIHHENPWTESQYTPWNGRYKFLDMPDRDGIL